MILTEVIVLEKKSRWAPELHRQLAGDGAIVRASRDITDLRERITTARTSGKNCIAVLDPAGWPGECLPVISWLRSLHIHVIVVGYVGIDLLEPSLRELGTTILLLPPVAGDQIGNACRRLLGQHSVQSRNTGSS
ncbi:MAG: hypothetical protein HQ518_10040 [Rhodopirellula sp.]|nr:hypothetical protein [Rhodopirellula sp.]